MHRVPVKAIMQSHVITIHPNELAVDAAQLMDDHKIRRIPVVDDEGYLVGIVTDTDVLEAETAERFSHAYEPGVETEWLAVSDIMTRDVITVGPESTVGQLVIKLMEHKIGGLPVVVPSPEAPKRQRVIGVVSEIDVFRLIAEAWRQETTESMPVGHDS